MNVTIIGNGIAGVTSAETIRAADKNCTIEIITCEPYHFYSRPRLIELLPGKSTLEQITIHNAGWYERSGIKLRLSTRIGSIDTNEKRLRVVDGEELPYETLVIAAGASCAAPPAWMNGLETVFALRNVDDALAIGKAATTLKRAVVVGGGLLGLEVAASLIAAGVATQVIEVFDRLLPRQLDAQGSALLQKLLERKGHSFLTGKKIAAIERRGGALAVRLEGGSFAETDFVVVAAGIRSNTALVDGTPIVRNRGIVVDKFMRTNVPGVYACGDIAEYNGIVCGLWQAGREQGAVCGGQIIGKTDEYRGTVPATRLKVAGLELASIGDIENKNGWSETVEIDETAGIYKKLFTEGKRLRGAILIGNVKEATRLQQAVKNGGDFVT
jgi:nitrite reductase (NADH) large subunit